MAASFRRNTYRGRSDPGIYVRHRKGCPAGDGLRCRCKPSYRARRADLGWSPSFASRDAAAAWKASARAGAETVAQRKAAGPTFGALAIEWWSGVQSGAIGKRKGTAGYSATTLAGYERSLRYLLAPLAFGERGPSDFENRPAADLDAEHWQRWVDSLARKGLSRSRIANHLAVVSAIYGWASRATRGLVPTNPTLSVELPPNDEKPRDRVATADEAQRLLAALSEDDRVPYALAFYVGLRRSEIHRLDWSDVDLEGLSVAVRRSKSDAGTGRCCPIAPPLRAILLAAHLRAGRPTSGRVSPVSVMSGKLAERARKAWARPLAPLGIVPPVPVVALDPIGLHECRHTYASLLVAAGYNLKEVMLYMGHADLQTTSRYVKRLPQPGEARAADRLARYLEGSR